MGTYSNQDYRTRFEQAPAKGAVDPLFMLADSRRTLVGSAAGAVFNTVMPEKSFAIPSNPYGHGLTEAMPVYARPQTQIDTTQEPTGFLLEPKEKETAMNPASVIFGGNLAQADDLQPLNYIDGMAQATAADRIVQVGGAAVNSEGLSDVQ